MINNFQNHINTKLSFLKSSKLLLAISGGIDSVALTHLCHNMGLNITLAHCNFNLRGKESDADEDFVMQLADALDLEVFVEVFDTEIYAKNTKQSIQMAARTLRYDWFKTLATQLKFDYILTAHHADDNLETFLINFTRGTGLEGLTGIPEINGHLIRPLLPFSRQDIETYVHENNLKWVEDKSNSSTKYLRNKLRHDVIPILKTLNPSLLQSFQATLNNLQDVSAIVQDSIENLKMHAIETSESNTIKIKISEIKKHKNPKAYLFELLKAYGFTAWDDVVNLLEAQSGKYVFSETWRLIKDRDYLLLSHIVAEEQESILISESETSIETPLGILHFEEVSNVSNSEKNTVFVDKSHLKFPLTIRTWQEGDVFYPLGMTGKKKLSKYFKDEKFSTLDKEQALLLCSENTIVWVIGKRTDNRFKVSSTTKNILKIELKELISVDKKA